MPLTLTTLVPSTIEPITIADLKTHLTGTFTDAENGYMNALISAAREALEIETRRQFATATYRLSLDCFPWDREIRIPRPPLVSVTQIRYLDTTNTEIIMPTTDYAVDSDSEPGRIWSVPSKCWPATYEVPNAVKITYIAGWPNVEAMPNRLKQLMLLVSADLYTNRVSPTAEGCLDLIPYIREYTRSLKVPTIY